MPFELLLRIVTEWVYPIFVVVFFFGLTIFIHEFGHFIVAKRRGLKIERFSIGFGPAIWKWTSEGIEYRVSWIPFGGYVALPQMAPMEAIEGETESKAEQLPPASPVSKMLVAVAGPIFNIMLGFLLATCVYVLGLPMPVNPNIVGWVEPGSREEQIGIREGDRIVKINDETVKTWDKINFAVAVNEGPTVRVVVERDGKQQEYLLETEIIKAFGIKTINLYPQGRPYASRVRLGSPAEQSGILANDKFLAVEGVPLSTQQELRDLIGKRPNLPTKVTLLRRKQVMEILVTPALDPRENVGRMGVELMDQIEFQVVRPGPTPWAQFADAFGQMGRTFNALIHYRQTKVGLDSMAGPIGISVGWWAQIVHGGLLRGLWFAVVINIALAVFNLLPLPVLDGGHIVFALIEAAIRKPLNPVFLHRLTTGCAAILIAFMLYISFNDVRRFIPWPSKAAPRPISATETNSP